jgi:hypothetical protein
MSTDNEDVLLSTKELMERWGVLTANDQALRLEGLSSPRTHHGT